MIIVRTRHHLPENASTTPFRLPLPTPKWLRKIVIDAAADWGAENGQREVSTTNKAIELLVRNLTGLTATDARRLAIKAIADDGAITESEMPDVMRAKYELLRGRTRRCRSNTRRRSFLDIGGMSRLRQWPKSARLLRRGRQTQTRSPARLLPSACKVVKVSRRKPRRESSRRCYAWISVCSTTITARPSAISRKALETAELMSPCVLWMDEIEKGLSVSDGTMACPGASLGRC